MEFAGLVLEDQLLDHLATPEGCMAVWRERLDPEIIPEINEGVREALSFVIAYIDEYGQPPDVAVLSEETGYEDFETPIAPIEYVIDKLKERKVRQELKRAITKVSKLIADPYVAAETMLRESSRIIAENLSYRDVLDSCNTSLVLERYKERQLVKDSGISFGYEAIDNALGGMRKGELYFVVGRPGRYKSWQLIKSATESFQNGANVVIETLEMSAAEMQDRFLCMLAGVSWDQFQHGALPPKDEDILAEAHTWLADQSNKVFFHHPPLHERTVAHMRQFGIEVGADVLYVDQLSFIQANRKSDQQWIEVGYKCQELKEATSEFPILCAAQFNREAAKAKSVKDLDLANIGLSDSVGQTADLVLGLYANKDMMNNRLLQYGIVKSRSFSERAWEIKVNLGIDSNFYLVDELDWEDL
jgi:replicative DNA helicase